MYDSRSAPFTPPSAVVENPPFRSTWACDIRARVEEAEFEAIPVLGNLLHRGHRGVLSSAPKVGKSTYLSWLVATSPARPMIYLTEMTTSQWDDLTALWPPEKRKPGGVRFIFREDVFAKTWMEIVAGLSAFVDEEGHQAIVVDTARRFFQLEMGGWNDPGPVQLAVDATDPICDAGCGILFVHHERKSGGAHAEGLSGTSAFAGAVDTVCTMKRVPGTGVRNLRQRRLTFESRFPVPAVEIVTWLDDDFGFSSNDPLAIVLKVMGARGMTEKEILAGWPKGSPAPVHSAMHRQLTKMFKLNLLVRVQVEGGTAWRYSAVSPSKGE